jgi:hypothetical protein
MKEIHFTPKNAEFDCKICDFKCSKKSDWTRHVSTVKHLYGHNGNIKENMETTKNAKYVCNCNKEFLTNSGLWKHNKICKIDLQSNKLDSESNNKEINENTYTGISQETILSILKQNSELQQMLIEQNKTIIELSKNNQIINNTTHTNSHNKAFNLNFFLNETCKDAMNIMDFVESIQLQLSDLENVGKLGYVNGISNIIIKNLKELDMEKRPVHCTDKKRETMYIKDENKWEKDEKNNKIRKAIKKVVSKNQRVIPKFKEAHPDCNTYHSKYNDQYNKLILESCGGSGDNDLEKEEKIIQNISKTVLVDK